MTTQEIKHSAFLAFLLDPKSQHELGDKFLSEFLKAVYEYIPESGKPNSEILQSTKFFELIDDKKIAVQTERPLTIPEGGRIDICIEAPNKKIIFVIENKVFTSTHDEQLSRYEKEFENLNDWTKVFVYLTPNGDLPFEGATSKNNWCTFSYKEILKILSRFKPTNRKVKFLTEDYMDMVDTNILKNNKEIAALCKKIRREHKEALELLLSYDNTAVLMKYCFEYLSTHISGFKLIKQTDLSFTFYTE